ncbi:hypothetical protein [Pandoraea commovens]|uniref:Uncharacterized protein n=1 Tax=Pandoraea commovens TaxID=2508289 RepID=A0ABY5QM03_9BURK|nr:hypothetical protein [Pandoraea commovens]UVA81393.1 hypothetical protein NTU39_10460 [Pandoraea commovens]
MRIGFDAGNGHSLAPSAQWVPEAPATLFSTFSSAWQGLRQAESHIESLEGGAWEAHHGRSYAPDPSHELPLRPPPVATPVEFTQIMAEVCAAHERPPPVATPVEFTRIMAEVCAAHERPPPVATPVEFTQIMAEVYATHERPRPVATPAEFTQIMTNVRAAHEARALGPDGASWQKTSPHVPCAERNLTPTDIHGIVARLREQRMVYAGGRPVGLATIIPSGQPPMSGTDAGPAAFSAALVLVQTQSDRVTTNEVPRGTSQNASRGRGRTKVTGELLRRIEALGASGIAAKGGIDRIADEHGIAQSTLRAYISKCGKLSPEGSDRAAEPGQFRTEKVTIGLLRALEKMGTHRIKSRGGLRAIARDEGIPYRTLKGYVDRHGKPTALGRARLLDDGDPTRRAKKVPVTPELLHIILRLGANGIRAAGGLRVLADRHNVFLSSLRSHVNGKGVLGHLGIRMMKVGWRPRLSKISNELLRDIEALGPRGIKAAGGLAVVAKANHVAFDTLRGYIDCRGQLTPLGRARLYGIDPSHTNKVTPTLLREIQALGKQGIASEGGLDALASKRGVAPHILRHYVTFGGKLKHPGRVMMARFESNNVGA